MPDVTFLPPTKRQHGSDKWLLGFAIAMVVVILGATGLQIVHEREAVSRQAMTNSANLVRAFEEHVVATVKAIDQLLLNIARDYRRDPDHFDLDRWVQYGDLILHSSATVLGTADANGIVDASNIGRTGINIADREHFTVHRDNPNVGLFIGKPVVARGPGKWSIQFTRRLERPDGSFAGTITMGLDPDYFADFYSTISVGDKGVIGLVGIDGVIRARLAAGDRKVGDSILGSSLFRHLAAASVGSYVTQSATDGVERFFSYRRIRDYPLIVSVGLASDDVLADYYGFRRALLLGAAALSLLVVLAAIWLGREVARRQDSELLLAAVLRAAPNPILVRGADLRIRWANPVYREFFGDQVADPAGGSDGFRPATAVDSAIEAADREVLRTGHPILDFEQHYPAVDGRPERHILVTKAPILDASGKCVQVLTIGTDITAQKKAQAEAEEARRLLQNVLDNVPVSIQTKDRDLRLVWTNPAFDQLNGVSSQAWIGKRIDEVVSDLEVARAVQRDDLQVLTTGQPIGPVERPLVDIRGERRDVLATKLPLRGADGEVRQVMTVALDITERRRAERALEQLNVELEQRVAERTVEAEAARRELAAANATLLDAIEALPDGFALFDAADRLVLFNQRYREIYRKSGGVIAVGRSFDEMLRDGMRLGQYPDAIGHEEEWLARRLRQHRQLDEEVEQRLDHDHWLRIVEQPTRAGGRVGVRTDITELKRREEALRASEARFRAVTESVPEGIVTVDDGGLIVFGNPALEGLFGYSGESLIGQPIALLFRDWEDIARRPAAPARADGSVIEVFGRRIDGSDVGVDLALSHWEHAGATYCTGVMRSNADRKHAEAERAKLQEQFHRAQQFQALGTLAGGVAHDFNNILAIIIGHAEVLEQGLATGSPLRTNAAAVIRASERAAEVVKQILAYSRQDRRAMAPVRLDLLLQEELTLLRAAMPATVGLKVRIEPGLTVLGNRTQLHQVMMNLCVNASLAIGNAVGEVELMGAVETIEGAAHAAPLRAPGRGVDTVTVGSLGDGETLAMWLGALPAGRHIHIGVRDGGVGMERAVLERMFDPFFTTREVGRGTGLGLAAVRGIVAGMGGAIVVRTAPGRGTSVDLYFPATDQPTAPPEAIPAPATAIGRGKRVLYVEDEAALVQTTERRLRGLGFTVVAQCDPRVALERFRQAPAEWDLVITDHSMPHMTGVDLARAMLALRPELPVILCTGYTEAIGPEGARALGIREFLMKPVSASALALAIGRALAFQPAS